MLALENVIRRAASGLPLDLRYPPPAAQRSQTQGRAAPSRKSARDPPQKKLASRTPAPPPTTRPQTRGIQPPVASEEAAREAVARAEERYQLKMRQRPSQDEPVHKKRLILPEDSEEEGEEEEEEEEEDEEAPDGQCRVLQGTVQRCPYFRGVDATLYRYLPWERRIFHVYCL
ncbi:uncharacterized protein LOC131317391 [Rhododendron vialii]|uniref:uncharacterized protein LOC131317391 n=1 Tax=Rhododendron vialii TaxID=182163 RepID=UPI00265E652C|nr:uncharacterized protein LOC131317391 [Rhododendron vialii]